jgi:phospholipase C
MRRSYLVKLFVAALVISLATFVASLAGWGGRTNATPAPPAPQPLSPIEHVVVIVQENRSTDNLFQDPVLIARGANIAQAGLNSEGQVITLEPEHLENGYDLDHSHKAFEQMYDHGAMDGANLIAVTCGAGVPDCPNSNPHFRYVYPSDVAPYFQMAEQYTFADDMFQTNQGPSFPAHQFILSGTSAPTATSLLFAAENPVGGNGDAGCAASGDARVLLIDPSGKESSSMYPCFEHPTLVDLLDSAGISWLYYTPTAGTIWTAPDAIYHLRYGKDWAKIITPATWILTNIANGKLQDVSWVVPTDAESDHAMINDGTGPAWVASIVNAIGKSQYWANTAIFITWDDWGGWYDHVPPPQYNSYEYGFRVPLIVVSPYANPGYVSHVQHDFGSIIKFIEWNFNLPSLGYADARADDLLDFFNFTQSPIPYKAVPAIKDANFFLNDRRPAGPPDDD